MITEFMGNRGKEVCDHSVAFLGLEYFIQNESLVEYPHGNMEPRLKRAQMICVNL